MQEAAKTPLDYQALIRVQVVETILAKDALVASKDATIVSLQQQVADLKRRVDWFNRQLFGAKSERSKLLDNPQQLLLADMLGKPDAEAPADTRTVAAHQRTAKRRDVAAGDESTLFFDESKVPVETIVVANPAAQGLSPEQYSVIGEKLSYRLAQRPASYVVLKYVRPVIKRRDAEAPVAAPAPAGVIEGSRADVSFIAGLLIDKFAWHLPLYRQHQRLQQAGFRLSRPWLTQLGQKAIALLQPIYDAQLLSIRQSHVIGMDETPIKAGRSQGKMKQGYLWPVFGDQDEICFPFFPSRAHGNVRAVLGELPEGTVLISDGYSAYDRYAAQTGIDHAHCWAHTRRGFFEAQAADPQGAAEAIERIGAIYAVEAEIKEKLLGGESKRLHRLEHSKRKVDGFFDWVADRLENQGLLPSNPLTKALAYAHERRRGLEQFLLDPDVPIDTNHLERALRPIPMGRKNWLFCWTEFGAKQVGIVQSLIVTCRLQGIDPYTYLIDVLQRVGQHPASRVEELTPRLWKQHFASNPLRSDLHSLRV